MSIKRRSVVLQMVHIGGEDVLVGVKVSLASSVVECLAARAERIVHPLPC